jgi:sarcosine dehydrogenase
VAIFDQSYFGNLHVGGGDAFAAVQWLCGADMKGRTAGDVVYTTLCNSQGGVEADLTVTTLSDGRYYFCAGGNTMTKDIEWMQRAFEHCPTELKDVTLTDDSKDWTILSVQGPHSRSLLSPLITSGHTLTDDSIPFSTCLEGVSIAGVAGIRILRLTFVGELGFELHVPHSQAAEVYEAVRTAGERHESEHGVPVRDAGYHAIDTLSAEKNYRHWHADLCNRDSPMEAGVGFTVLPKLKNGIPFMGSDALQKKREAGLQRKLICLVADSPDVLCHGFETIWRADQPDRPIGYVRSTAYGHSIGRTIVYGYVDCPADMEKITNKWLSSGEWSIGAVGERHAATFHLKAPFDPTGRRVQGEYDSKPSGAQSSPMGLSATYAAQHMDTQSGVRLSTAM